MAGSDARQDRLLAIARAAESLVSAWEDLEIGERHDDRNWIAEALADERTARALLRQAVRARDAGEEG